MKIETVVVLHSWDYDDCWGFKGTNVDLLNAVDRIEYYDGNSYYLLYSKSKVNYFSSVDKLRKRMAEIKKQ
jgi:hypothetical protein